MVCSSVLVDSIPLPPYIPAWIVPPEQCRFLHLHRTRLPPCPVCCFSQPAPQVPETQVSVPQDYGYQVSIPTMLVGGKSQGDIFLLQPRVLN